MYKKMLLSLVVILSCAGTVVHAADTVDELETDFYRALSVGDASTAYQQLHPGLQELVDLPVLEAWSIAIRDNLGSYTSKTQNSINRSQRLTGLKIDVESELEFERGKANASMGFFDGQLVSFRLQSDELVNWFQGPSRIDVYTEAAESFISSFFQQNTEQARSLMHESLQKAVADNKLESIIQKVVDNAGDLKSSKLQSHRMSLETDRQVLILVFSIEGEKASGECEIEFQFVGMQGHFISFDFR